jgi:hypothetical protein
MRGSDVTTGSLFSYVDIEERILARHVFSQSSTFDELGRRLKNLGVAN